MGTENWGWTSIQMKDVKVGNYVSGILATHPRKISKVEFKDGKVVLYEEGRETPYMTNTEDRVLDLLIDCKTKKPVESLKEK